MSVPPTPNRISSELHIACTSRFQAISQNVRNSLYINMERTGLEPATPSLQS